MWAFWITVVLWNACALGLGVIGLYKPSARDWLAQLANRQATAAAGVSSVHDRDLSSCAQARGIGGHLSE